MKQELLKAQVTLNFCIAKQQDLRARIDEIEKNNTFSEVYREAARGKLTVEAFAYFTDAKEIFYKDIDLLEKAYSEQLNSWKNANSPQLATILHMIDMGISPQTVVLEQFRGDMISLDIIAKALENKEMMPFDKNLNVNVSLYYFDEICEKFNKACNNWKFNGFYQVDSYIKQVADKMGYEYKCIEKQENEETQDIRAIMGLK